MKPTNFIDPTATIGEGTSVWHFACVMSHVVIGDNCSIGSRAEVGIGTSIGHGSRISSGVFLPANSVIGDKVFIGPNTTFTDDRYPRAGSVYVASPPIVEDGASIGAGCVILPGVHIGAGAMIGAGSVVTKDVKANTTVRGESAVCTSKPAP